MIADIANIASTVVSDYSHCFGVLWLFVTFFRVFVATQSKFVTN